LGAAVLAKALKGVSDDPEGEGPWLRLFTFPSALTRPRRGGVRRNLTTSVQAKLRVFQEGGELEMGDGGDRRGGGRGRVEKGGEGEDREAARRASIKVGDRDVRGAVRVLCSDEGGVAPDAASAAQLRDKHPAAPLDRRPPPVASAQPFQATPVQVLQGVRFFAPGSAGGPDGLRPQHLSDLLGGEEKKVSFFSN